MKLVKEDDKLYHFETPDGGFKVVKKGLSKTAQDKINKIKEMCSGGAVQKMSDGGDVHPLDPDKTKDFVKGYQPSPSDQAATQAVQHPINALSKVLHLASGTPNGDVGQTLAQNDAQYDMPPQVGEEDPINPGTPPVSADRAPASVDPSTQLTDPYSSVGSFLGDKVIGGAVRGLGQLGHAVLDPLGRLTQGVEKGLGMDSPETSLATSATTQKTPDQIKAEIAAQGAGGGTQSALPDYTSGLSGAIGDYGKQAQNLAQIQSQGAAANAQAVQSYMKTGADYLKTAQDSQQQLMNENAQLSKDVANGHIDPNHFVNNQSTAGKISTTLGILFSGLGAGAHGTNMAVNILQDHINKDIDAQKADLGNKQNLLTQNFHRLGNLQAATAATQAQNYAMLQGQIMKQAYQDGSAGALAQAKMATDSLQMKMAPLTMQLSQYQAQRQLMSRNDIDPMTKAMMLGGPSTPMGKMYMQQAQQQQQTQKTMADFDQAAKDKGTLKYLLRDSPAQKALAVDAMGPLHKNIGLRGESLEHASTAYTPSLLGKFTGDNNLTRGHLFNMSNTIPLSPMASPATGMTNDEGDE